MAPTAAGRKKGKKKKADSKEPKEPKISWKKSEAKRLLYKGIMDGDVPLEAKDNLGLQTIPLCDIYIMHPQYALYCYDKFPSRLSSLRKTIKEANARAKDDEETIQKYKQNHPPSEVCHNGCIEWQGSEARELLLEGMEEELHIRLGKEELWGKRPEYFEYFPLFKVFRDKIYQEILTAKYTCQVKGK